MAEKGLLVCLASVCNRFGKTYVTKAQLSALTGISERTLWTMLDRLKEKGFLRMTEFRGRSGHCRNAFTLLKPCNLCEISPYKALQSLHDGPMKNLHGGSMQSLHGTDARARAKNLNVGDDADREESPFNL